MSSTASRLETGAGSGSTPYWEEIGPGMRVLRGEIDATEAIEAMKKFHKNSALTRKQQQQQRKAAASLRRAQQSFRKAFRPNQ